VLVATGVLEVLAVMSVSGGLSVGNAIIITPIASALTLVTVGLSVILLKIKVTPLQVVGVLGTVVGIVLMAIS
jgi:bacterial/archaeal transporter family protein